MGKIMIFSQTCMMYFILMWNISKCQDTYLIEHCLTDIDGGYITSDHLERHCKGLPGDVCDYECNPGFIKVDYKLYCQVDGFWHSVWHPDSKTFCTKEQCPSEFYGGYVDLLCSTACGSMCTFVCKTGFDSSNRHSHWLTCGENGEWSPDTNSSCVQSVEHISSLTELRSTDEGNVITIMGITAGSLFGMITIVVFVVWIAKRSILRKSRERVPGQAGNSCVRPSEYQLHDVTNIPQQINENGIGSVSSFESPSYGLYVHPFVQGIPTICSSCKYLEPPPSYNDTPMALNESPPTYEEVLTDPSRFYLTI